MIKLSPQQEKFAQEIVKGNSQAEAYRIAYPKSRNWKDESVWSKASTLMADVKVTQRVDELRAPVIKKVQLTADYVLGTIIEVVEVSRQMKTAPDGSDVMVDPSAALKGSELLGKHLKLFTDKQETLLTGNVRIVNEFDNDSE